MRANMTIKGRLHAGIFHNGSQILFQFLGSLTPKSNPTKFGINVGPPSHTEEIRTVVLSKAGARESVQNIAVRLVLGIRLLCDLVVPRLPLEYTLRRRFAFETAVLAWK